MKTFAEYAVEESIFEEYLDKTDEIQLLEDMFLATEGIFDYLRNPALAAAGAFDAGISGVGGTGKQILRGAGNIAGVFALGVAWFPTTEVGSTDLTGKIHLTFAILFFLTLAFYSLILFTKKGSDPTPQKLRRNIIYITCGLIMIACLIAMLVYFAFLKDSSSETSFVFWGETIALIAFGVSWLTKGGTLYPDK